MRKRKNEIKVLAFMVVGFILLIGSVFANIDDVSGYSSYKNAVRKLFKTENYTMCLKSAVCLDNAEISGEKSVLKSESGLRASKKRILRSAGADYKEGFSEEEDYISDQYIYDESDISVTDCWVDHSKAISVYINENEFYYKRRDPYNAILGDNIDTAVLDKALNFTGVIADGFVGDIKNNLVYLGEENGEKSYTVTLSKEQIPNIITSGLSLFSETIKGKDKLYEEAHTITTETKEYDYSDCADVIEMMFINEREPFVKSANCDFKIDENGNLKSNTLIATIVGYTNDGGTHTIDLKLELLISDIGTTVAEKPNLSQIINGDVQMRDGSIKSIAELTENNSILYIGDSANNREVDIINNVNEFRSEVYIMDFKEVTEFMETRLQRE